MGAALRLQDFVFPGDLERVVSLEELGVDDRTEAVTCTARNGVLTITLEDEFGGSAMVMTGPFEDGEVIVADLFEDAQALKGLTFMPDGFEDAGEVVGGSVCRMERRLPRESRGGERRSRQSRSRSSGAPVLKLDVVTVQDVRVDTSLGAIGDKKPLRRGAFDVAKYEAIMGNPVRLLSVLSRLLVKHCIDPTAHESLYPLCTVRGVKWDPYIEGRIKDFEAAFDELHSMLEVSRKAGKHKSGLPRVPGKVAVRVEPLPQRLFEPLSRSEKLRSGSRLSLQEVLEEKGVPAFKRAFRELRWGSPLAFLQLVGRKFAGIGIDVRSDVRLRCLREVRSVSWDDLNRQQDEVHEALEVIAGMLEKSARA